MCGWITSRDGVKRLGRNLMLVVGSMAKCPELYDFVNTYYGIEITDNVVVETTMQRIYQTMYGYNQLQTVADIASTDLPAG